MPQRPCGLGSGPPRYTSVTMKQVVIFWLLEGLALDLQKGLCLRSAVKGSNEMSCACAGWSLVCGGQKYAMNEHWSEIQENKVFFSATFELLGLYYATSIKFQKIDLFPRGLKPECTL